MLQGEESFHLDSYFCVKEVSVVQSVSLDVEGLKHLLSQLLGNQKQAEQKLQLQQQEINELRNKQAELERQQSQCGQHPECESNRQQQTLETVPEPPQATSTPAAPAHGVDSITSGVNDKLQGQLHDLNMRLTQLEQLQKPLAAAPPPLSHTGLATTAPGAAPAAPPAIAPAASQAAPPGAGDPAVSAADLQALKQQQQLLAGQVSALQGSLDAATDNISKQLFAGLASKADAGLLQGLQDALRSAADNKDLELLNKQLQNKADRSELDALLNLGTNIQAAPAVGSALLAEDAVAAAGNTGGSANGDASAAAQLTKLQLQLALLQERIANKADASSLSRLSDGLSGAKEALAQLQIQIHALSVQLAAAKVQLDDLGSNQREQYLNQQAQPVPTFPHPEGLPAPLVSPDIATQLEQLPLVLFRLSAVEDSLAAASAAAKLNQQNDAAPCGNSSGGGPPTDPAKLAADALPSSNALRDLASQLAALQAQVNQLVLLIRSNSRRDPASAATGTYDNAKSSQQDSSQAPVTMQQLQQEDNKATEDDDPSAWQASGFSVQGTAAGDAAAVQAAAALADLSVRVAELQEAFDGLGASKADRGELERLRVMLADTATQSDTEQLRHKLDAQQQQLARLAQQLACGGAAASHGSFHLPVDTTAPSASVLDILRSPKGAAGMSGAAAEAAWDSAAAGDVMAAATAGAGDRVDSCGSAWRDQVQQHLAGIEQLAEAVCLLATGQAASAAATAASLARDGMATDGDHPGGIDSNGGRSFSFGRNRDKEAAGMFGRAAGAGAGAGGEGRAGAGPGPQMARLRLLLQTGQVGRKLDWFDPTLLQKMAQRLAAAEALIKTPPLGSPAFAGAAGGSSDLDGRLKRLAGDVRVLKERLGDAAGAAAGRPGGQQGGWRAGDGDHTMLAAKPLAGYRCMACDRPLTSLDANPGPYLPNGHMPVSLASGAEMAMNAGSALGKLPPAGPSSRRGTVQDAVAAPSAADFSSPSSSPEPPSSRRVTGPQSWYQQQHGPPAEQLPKGDVGPHLPPGGWRGNTPRADDGAVLPVLARGGGGVVAMQGAGGVGKAGAAMRVGTPGTASQ